MVYVSKKEMAERRMGNYTMSFRIADKLSTEVFPKLDYMLDCHGGDLPEDIGDFILVSFTGNGRIDNGQRLMIECFNSEVIYVPEEERFSRSTTSFCRKELGIPALMIEGGQGYNLHMERTVFHYNGIVNLMKRLKMMLGTPKITSLPKNVEDFASTTIRKYASCGGLLYHRIGLGMLVSPGQEIAKIENLFGETVETIRWKPPETGRVYKVRSKRVPFPVNTGDIVLIIAGIPEEYSKLFGTRAYTYSCTNCTKGY
jgi:predicted deacylase